MTECLWLSWSATAFVFIAVVSFVVLVQSEGGVVRISAADHVLDQETEIGGGVGRFIYLLLIQGHAQSAFYEAWIVT